MEVFQNIMIVFLTVLLLGILIAFSILLEKFMELSDEVHKKLFEMSVENNTNVDDGFILGDEFLTEDELTNESDEDSREAQIAADTLIAQKENELEIKKAELQKDADTKKASADAAYSIQEENERKSVEIATADADLAKQEKAVEIKEKEIALTEKTLEATVKKQAEAEKYAKQQEADARLYETQRKSEASLFERQKNAEAEKFEREKEAEAMKATAEANKYAMEQEAEGIRSKGQAEADAIKAKALAEAEGIQKKAEAMKQMGEAAVLDMYFKAMPEIAKNIAEPLAKVDKITMYGDGNSSKLMKDIMNTLNQVTDGMKESTGIDLNSILAGFAGAKIAESTDK